MKKKSKFQERLDELSKNYTPEEDKGSINDKLDLHKMDDETISGGIQRRTSQTALRTPTGQPPNPLGLQRWKSVMDEKPRYYDPVNIWDGKEVLYNWARVACENGDYYVNQDDLVKYDVTHWSPPHGVDYPPYEPMTEDDIKLFTIRDINDIIKTIEQQNHAYDDNDFERGYNLAMTECLMYLKRTAREGKLKLHTRNTNKK
jgi:hypothetical protein